MSYRTESLDTLAILRVSAQVQSPSGFDPRAIRANPAPLPIGWEGLREIAIALPEASERIPYASFPIDGERDAIRIGA